MSHSQQSKYKRIKLKKKYQLTNRKKNTSKPGQVRQASRVTSYERDNLIESKMRKIMKLEFSNQPNALPEFLDLPTESYVDIYIRNPSARNLSVGSQME